nr:polyprenyl synthetase family protein [uncultured Capnocytophaga sp.]
MHSIEDYREAFLAYLNSQHIQREPRHLYEPINYILHLGGKRLRPILTLIATELFDVDYKKALDVATAVEVFHNFSLIHDDIMDKAPFRRGQATVHEKWNTNIGILSGDAMLIMAYRLLERYPAKTLASLSPLFSKTALEVCEGQQWDMDFESRMDVKIEEYIEMIRCKTAVLIGASLQMGAIIAEATLENQLLLYDFGINIGLAFQLQDDYLDSFGDSSFGKKIGGDIIENKKTMLYLKSLELGTPEECESLLEWYKISKESEEKIEEVKRLFEKTGGAKALREEIVMITNRALDVLEQLSISIEKREYLKIMALQLINREK